MTTFDDFSELDELASAIVDGEATAEERARMNADPELRARVAEFMLISEAVAEPVNRPSDADRDKAIAAALEHVTAVPAPAAAPAAAEVSSLAAHRAKKAGGFDRARILQAVAAFALVGIGGVGLWGLTQGRSDDLASDVTAMDAASDLTTTSGASSSEPLAVPVPDFDDADGDAMADAAMDEEEAAMDEAVAEQADAADDAQDAQAEFEIAEEAMEDEAAEDDFFGIEASDAGLDGADSADKSSDTTTTDSLDNLNPDEQVTWVAGEPSTAESFADRPDSLGTVLFAEQLIGLPIPEDGAPLNEVLGAPCPQILDELEDGDVTPIATALLDARTAGLQELLVVRATGADGVTRFTAVNLASCAIVIDW